MEYNVVYDVTLDGFRNWWLPTVGLVFTVASVRLVRIRHSLAWRIPSYLTFMIAGLTILVTAFVFLGVIGGHIALAARLHRGRCTVIEGNVTDFHAMRKGGHDKEWFFVGGKRFEYSDFEISAGFNHTAPYGGPIHKGLPVRVHYSGNTIAKLEIAIAEAPKVPH